MMRNYRRFKRMLSADFMVYLRASGKKSLPRQVSDIYRLYRAYDHLPYQYLKHGLYLRKFGAEIERYLPTELLHITRDAANADADPAVVEDKLLFERTIRSAGLRSTNSLFLLKRGGITDMAGQAIAYADFVAAIDALTLPDGIIIKPLTGGSGSAVFKLSAAHGQLLHMGRPLDDAEFDRLIFTTNNGHHWPEFVVQETISQHPDLSRFNPTSVNTIRIDTLADAFGHVHFNAAALKVGTRGSIVDNSSAGGYMIAIDLESGRLESDAKRESEFGGQYHDVRQTFDVDPSSFVVPFWIETRAAVQLAAKTLAPYRSLGWDIAITPNGPLVVEANADYGIDVLQELSGGYLQKPLGQEYLRRMQGKRSG